MLLNRGQRGVQGWKWTEKLNRKSVFFRKRVGFATSHSHINYYLDIAKQKSRLSEAKAVAKYLAQNFKALRRWRPFFA